LFTTGASASCGTRLPADGRRELSITAIPHDRVEERGSSSSIPKVFHRHGFMLRARTKSTIGGVCIAPSLQAGHFCLIRGGNQGIPPLVLTGTRVAMTIPRVPGI